MHEYIDTYTSSVRWERVSTVTPTPVATRRVQTLTIHTHSALFTAFINIFKGKTNLKVTEIYNFIILNEENENKLNNFSK